MSGYIPTKEDVAIINGFINEGWVDPDRDFSFADLASVAYRKGREVGIKDSIAKLESVYPDAANLLQSILEETK